MELNTASRVNIKSQIKNLHNCIQRIRGCRFATLKDLETSLKRYEDLWLPLAYKHKLNTGSPDDVLTIWMAHLLTGLDYRRDCLRVFGDVLEFRLVSKRKYYLEKKRAEFLWQESYPNEAFESADSFVESHQTKLTPLLRKIAFHVRGYFSKFSLPHFQSDDFITESNGQFECLREKYMRSSIGVGSDSKRYPIPIDVEMIFLSFLINTIDFPILLNNQRELMIKSAFDEKAELMHFYTECNTDEFFQKTGCHSRLAEDRRITSLTNQDTYRISSKFCLFTLNDVRMKSQRNLGKYDLYIFIGKKSFHQKQSLISLTSDLDNLIFRSSKNVDQYTANNTGKPLYKGQINTLSNNGVHLVIVEKQRGWFKCKKLIARSFIEISNEIEEYKSPYMSCLDLEESLYYSSKDFYRKNPLKSSPDHKIDVRINLSIYPPMRGSILLRLADGNKVVYQRDESVTARVGSCVFRSKAFQQALKSLNRTSKSLVDRINSSSYSPPNDIYHGFDENRNLICRINFKNHLGVKHFSALVEYSIHDYMTTIQVSYQNRILAKSCLVDRSVLPTEYYSRVQTETKSQKGSSNFMKRLFKNAEKAPENEFVKFENECSMIISDSDGDWAIVIAEWIEFSSNNLGHSFTTAADTLKADDSNVSSSGHLSVKVEYLRRTENRIEIIQIPDRIGSYTILLDKASSDMNTGEIIISKDCREIGQYTCLILCFSVLMILCQPRCLSFERQEKKDVPSQMPASSDDDRILCYLENMQYLNRSMLLLNNIDDYILQESIFDWEVINSDCVLNKRAINTDSNIILSNVKTFNLKILQCLGMGIDSLIPSQQFLRYIFRCAQTAKIFERQIDQDGKSSLDWKIHDFYDLFALNAVKVCPDCIERCQYCQYSCFDHV